MKRSRPMPMAYIDIAIKRTTTARATKPIWFQRPRSEKSITFVLPKRSIENNRLRSKLCSPVVSVMRPLADSVTQGVAKGGGASVDGQRAVPPATDDRGDL